MCATVPSQCNLLQVQIVEAEKAALQKHVEELEKENRKMKAQVEAVSKGEQSQVEILTKRVAALVKDNKEKHALLVAKGKPSQAAEEKDNKYSKVQAKVFTNDSTEGKAMSRREEVALRKKRASERMVTKGRGFR